MNNEVYHKATYSFRFVNLKEEDVAILKIIFASELKTSKMKDSNKFVAVIDMNNDSLNGKIEEAVNKISPDKSSYGIWVSLVTESDQDGLTVPDFVSQLHCRLGGKIDFSFSVV